MPAAIFAWACCSMWKPNSSSTSRWVLLLIRKRKRISSSLSMAALLNLLQHQRDGADESVPVFELTGQLLFARSCERIELGFAIVLGCSPLSLDPALVLQPVECRVER